MSNRFKKQLAKQIAAARRGGAVSSDPLSDLIAPIFAEELDSLEPPTPTGPVKHVSFTIQFEPMEDEYLAQMSEDALARLDDIGEDVVGRGKPRIADLEEMILAYPDVPKLYNYLYVSYILAHRNADADHICAICYERFPDYLFGAVCYANLCLRQGRVDEADKVFEGRRLINEFLKGRTEIHITEFATFYVTLGLIEVERGNLSAAKRFLEMVEQVDPDSRNLDTLRARIRQALVPRVVDRLIDRVKVLRRSMLTT